ncbi:SRPBCC family protein [Nocardioides sp.]|uniref:SRPBCC family protein n=1 Tax=Nocardioides sp. TaxID=35761 RepID=UPI0025E68F61|nr:SRPBCC family protein [Nocardioides sp.]
MVAVAFPVSREVAFDYLADPHNRPAWQSSLARVEDVDGEVRVGQTWVDVTSPGLRPLMETTELDRPRRWSERGTWRGFDAVLTLDFAETATGCDVAATMRVTGRGIAALPARVLSLVAPRAVRSDLRRAARVLGA